MGEELTSIAQKISKGCESVEINAKGATGGMGILWNPWDVNFSSFVATPFSHSAEFHILGTRIKGFMTNVYGPPREEHKLSFLDSLSVINEIADDKPWILGGDFNLIRNLEEKKGGIWNLNPASAQFNELIDDLNSIDVRTSNGIFTWNNKQVGDRGITCRLDHFLISESIMVAGGELRAVLLPTTSLDNWPISLEWENVGINPCKPFIFENFWLLQTDFHEKIWEWWEGFPPIKGTRMYQFQ